MDIKTLFKKLGIFSLSLLILGLFCHASVEAAPFIEGGIGFGGWASKLTGNLAYKQGLINLDADLDLSTTKVAPKAWAELELPIPLFPNIRADVVVFKYTGSSTVTNLGFGDYVFNGSISSKLKLNQYDFLLYYHIPFIRFATANSIDIRWGLEGRYFDGYVRVSGTASGISVTEEKNFSFIIPMAYLGATLSPPGVPFRVLADARGISYEGSYYYDFEGKVEFTLLKLPPVGRIFVDGGYKWEHLRLKEGKPINDFETKSTLQGVFAEVGLDF